MSDVLQSHSAARSARKGRTPSEQYQTAEARVQDAIAAKKTSVSFVDLKRLGRLPSSTRLGPFSKIEADETKIRSLEPLDGMDCLNELSINYTHVKRSNISTGLHGLQVFSAAFSLIQNIEFLSKSTHLRVADLQKSHVTSIEALRAATFLTNLNLSHSRLIDLSPLSQLVNLEILHLDGISLCDLSFLGDLVNLKHLSLSSSYIKNVEALQRLKSLETLSLRGTSIDNLQFAADLPHLEGLSIEGTDVRDLSPLSECTSLKRLHASRSAVTSLHPIRNHKLDYLTISHTDVLDLEPIASMTSLSKAAFPRQPGVRAGLFLNASPAARQQHILEFRYLNQPRYTVKVLNAIRAKSGLPPYFPELYVEDEQSYVNQDDEENISTRNLTQRPASHSFTYANDAIFGHPARLSPNNNEVASEIRSEVVIKARDAEERLVRSNAPPRLIDTVVRIRLALGSNVSDVKAGILQMRFRTIEADIAALRSAEGRLEIADDIYSALLDLSASVEDFLGCFPQLTEIEAERVAQKLKDNDVPSVLQALVKIREAAEASPMVAMSAIDALREGERDLLHDNELINFSTDPQVQLAASLARDKTVGYMLLVYRNFVARSLKVSQEVGGVAAEAWGEFKVKAPPQLADAGTAIIVAVLVHALVGPTAALGAFAASFKPLRERAQHLSQKIQKRRNGQVAKKNGA